ncbi:FAD-dependent oxidoreductase, partial [Candidatus Kaiserbacteria bacterium]|nr:FAD-dependent oxidoreductase [Candidatus Kaiserbacteria bacterium]
MKEFYDVIVIGAGSGGLTAAVGASKVGKKVLLVEREHMGGECTNTGCVPSKALLHVAKQYYEAKQIGEIGTLGETYRNEAFSYVRKVIEGFLKHETPETFEKMGIDVVLGEAVFNTKCSIKVDETEYHYKNAVIATGSSPRIISIAGFEESKLLTNQNFFELQSISEKTLIIGAGPIGLEMGQALAMLGSEVTIATIDNEFAKLEDESIRPIVKKNFKDLGIDIKLNAFINRVEDSVAIFDIKNGDRIVDELRLPFDKILMAIGRVPNLPAGLETAGIKYDKNCIHVDNQYRTSNKYVYAVGDVSQKLKFTHTADDTARQVVTRIASRGLLRVDTTKAVPKVTYTSPEIAQVGMSWPEAIKKYGEERLMRVEVPFSQNDRAVTDSTDNGVLVVIVRRINGAILGAHIIGPRAGEIISLFTLAIDEKISLWRFQKLIFAYPSYSLIIKKAADQFAGRQLGDLKNDLVGLIKRGAPKIILGAIWAIGLWQFYAYQQAHDMTVTETALMVFDFVSMTIWGPLIYILAYAIRPLTFFPGTLLTILSGVFFGFWTGTFLTIIAANISSSIAYVVGRYFGGRLALEDSVIGKWVTVLREGPFISVLTTRLIFLPFDGVSYAAGILKLPFVSFLLATFVGTLLGIATFVSIGASLNIDVFRENGFSTDVIDDKFILISVVIFVASVGVSKLLKR